MPATFSNESGRTAFVLGQLGAPALPVMSDELDWNFRGPDNAKAEIRAAVSYLLKDAAASDRSDIVWDVIAIVNQVARSRGHDPLDDGAGILKVKRCAFDII